MTGARWRLGLTGRVTGRGVLSEDDEVSNLSWRRMIEDMTVRKFTLKTQNDYIRVVKPSVRMRHAAKIGLSAG